jgi:hypothetical protein
MPATMTTTAHSARECTLVVPGARDAGFAALLAVIMVATMLTAAVAAASLAGTRAAAQAANREWRTQARALADGCATIALTKLLANVSYSGDEEATLPTGTCRTLPLQRNVPQLGTITIRTQGTAHGFPAFVTVITRTQQRCSPSSPIPYGIAIDSWIEVPSHE